jgi:hypothetical protein
VVDGEKEGEGWLVKGKKEKKKKDRKKSMEGSTNK